MQTQENQAWNFFWEGWADQLPALVVAKEMGYKSGVRGDHLPRGDSLTERKASLKEPGARDLILSPWNLSSCLRFSRGEPVNPSTPLFC